MTLRMNNMSVQIKYGQILILIIIICKLQCCCISSSC